MNVVRVEETTEDAAQVLLLSLEHAASGTNLTAANHELQRHTSYFVSWKMSSFFKRSVKFYSCWIMLDVRLSLSTRCTPAQLNELWHMKRRPLHVVDGMARRKQSPSCNGKGNAGNGSNASNGSYRESQKTAVGSGWEWHGKP